MTPRECIREAIRKAVGRHREVDAQILAAQRAVRGLPEFESYRESLVDDAIQREVYEVRSEENRAIRRSNPETQSFPKVKVGESRTVRDAYAHLYEMNVIGKQLGDLTGEELEPAAAQDEEAANGRLARARLFRSLRKVVADGKKVRDAVSGKKLERLYEAAGLLPTKRPELTLAEAGH
jgi:hypothetical protein